MCFDERYHAAGPSFKHNNHLSRCYALGAFACGEPVLIFKAPENLSFVAPQQIDDSRPRCPVLHARPSEPAGPIRRVSCRPCRRYGPRGRWAPGVPGRGTGAAGSVGRRQRAHAGGGLGAQHGDCAPSRSLQWPPLLFRGERFRRRVQVLDPDMRRFLYRYFIALRGEFADVIDVTLALDASRFGGREQLCVAAMNLDSGMCAWAPTQVFPTKN